MKTQNKKACRLISEAIADENKGKQFYAKLSKELDKRGKLVVSGIGKQEGKHKKKLVKLRKKLIC